MKGSIEKLDCYDDSEIGKMVAVNMTEEILVKSNCLLVACFDLKTAHI
jgi:hypothetical protein